MSLLLLLSPHGPLIFCRGGAVHLVFRSFSEGKDLYVGIDLVSTGRGKFRVFLAIVLDPCCPMLFSSPLQPGSLSQHLMEAAFAGVTYTISSCAFNQQLFRRRARKNKE